METKVSVITPVYNAEAFITHTIQSVLNQTFQHWEMILVDDASTDNSVAIIKSFQDKRIQLIGLDKNSGPAIARNTAILKAKGRYIAFLDSDDIWLPEKLEKQIAFIQQKKCAIVHSAYEIINANGKRTGKIISAPELLTYNQLLNYNYIGCLTGMYDTKLTGKVLMPNIAKRQDYGLWLSILRVGHTACFQPEVLALYRTGRKSISSNKATTAAYNWKILREIERLPLWKAAWHFGVYTFLGFKKYYF